jgi:hypothetical protein
MTCGPTGSALVTEPPGAAEPATVPSIDTCTVVTPQRTAEQLRSMVAPTVPVLTVGWVGVLDPHPAHTVRPASTATHCLR